MNFIRLITLTAALSGCTIAVASPAFAASASAGHEQVSITWSCALLTEEGANGGTLFVQADSREEALAIADDYASEHALRVKDCQPS